MPVGFSPVRAITSAVSAARRSGPSGMGRLGCMAVPYPDDCGIVNANIAGRELQDLVPLPRFVMRAGNNLWVVDDSGHLRNRQVTLLRTGGDVVYVSDGLAEGERVALTIMDGSFDSSKVTIQSSTPSNMLDQSGRPKATEEAKSSKVTAAVEPATDDSAGG